MKNSASLNSIYSAHPFNYNRLKTDELFTLPEGSVNLKGNLDYAVRFIEDYQLMSPELWAKFVTQFRATQPKADDADDGWRGEYWGKMMRGACFTYAYTQNAKLYEVLTETVKDMMTTQDELGRISSYSVKAQYRGWDIWSRKYVILGMQYFIEICKDKELIAEITKCLCRQVDYMIDTLGREEDGKLLITKATSHWLGMNSSSVLEPVVRLYNLTKEKKYLDFAEYIIDCGVISTPGVSIFELAYEDKLDPYQYPVVKAYEMMSCFEGLLEYYRVTGIEKWKTALVNFANRVRLSEISVIGSSGCTHELFDHTVVRETNTDYNGVMQETCVTVTWMKFCYQLLCLTGDSVYADEIEKSIYNALIGAINFKRLKDNGDLPFDSYSPLLFNSRLRGVGGKKTMADGSFYGCCACIGSAGTGLIGMASVMLSDGGFNVNLYANGEFTVPTPSGKTASFKIETKYPENGIITLTAISDCDEEIAIGMRIPAWSEKTLASVCGEAATAKAGGYAIFKRVWKSGEFITLSLDMRCILKKALADEKDPNSEKHVSLRRGPLALARDIRLPGNFESVVNFAPDASGAVPCELSDKCDFEHNYCFAVKEADGNEIIMVDYASAGTTWDDQSMTTVWMPTENYWAVDITTNFQIYCPNIWDPCKEKYSLTANNAGEIVVSAERYDTFSAEPSANGMYRIRHSSGKYFDLSEDGSAVVLTDTGREWRIVRNVQNRYRIYDDSGRAMFNNRNTRPAFAAPHFDPNQVFRFIQK